MEALATAQLDGELVETGGMLLGRIDDACRVIWITAATSPTADSERAQHYFRHGLAGVGGITAGRDAKSRGRERFVGIWHTHPFIEPVPSRPDLAAMDTLLVPVPDAPYRGVLAIFGGRGPLWSGLAARPGKPDGACRPLPDVTAATARSLRDAGVLARLAALARRPLPTCSGLDRAALGMKRMPGVVWHQMASVMMST